MFPKFLCLLSMEKILRRFPLGCNILFSLKKFEKSLLNSPWSSIQMKLKTYLGTQNCQSLSDHRIELRFCYWWWEYWQYCRSHQRIEISFLAWLFRTRWKWIWSCLDWDGNSLAMQCHYDGRLISRSDLVRYWQKLERSNAFLAVGSSQEAK